MTEADLDQVLTIEQASFKTPWKRSHFEAELAGRYSFPFVAESGGRIVGYVCLMSLFEEAQILDIAVVPEQRGRGVGRVLIDHAVRIAREQRAEFLALEVRASSTDAIALYLCSGFGQVGVRSGYYGGTEDAILMEKKLKETA